jgi:hypothetical protein
MSIITIKKLVLLFVSSLSECEKMERDGEGGRGRKRQSEKKRQEKIALYGNEGKWKCDRFHVARNLIDFPSHPFFCVLL